MNSGSTKTIFLGQGSGFQVFGSKFKIFGLSNFGPDFEVYRFSVYENRFTAPFAIETKLMLQQS